jgi:protein-tyrosine kinase
MSRIHEALKRAEAQLNGGPVESVSMRNGVEEAGSLLDAKENFGPLLPSSISNAPSTLATSNSMLPNWLDELPQALWKPDASKMLFSDPSRNNEPGMEEFRTLRSRLYRLRQKMPLTTVMVSSALPGEGKTFVTANLAYALARQHGRRVLLIDADLRKPSLHESIGTKSKPGLSDFLAGDSKLESIVQRGAIENLFFVPGGSIVSNPAELIGSGQLDKLLDQLRPCFDWILLDTAPLVPITDSTLVARSADGILLVVKTESTRVELAQRAKEELKNLPLLGVVLNRAATRPGYSSYYYYAYGQRAEQ